MAGTNITVTNGTSGHSRRARANSEHVVFQSPQGTPSTPELDAVVMEVIGRVADKWTMCVLEVLAQNGVLRFSRIGDLVGGISQRMLTKTLRQLEHDGFVTRTVYPEVPPRVEYQLTALGESLCEAFCTVWLWAEAHYAELQPLRRHEEKTAKEAPSGR